MKTRFSNDRRAVLIRRMLLIGGVISTLILSIMLGMLTTPPTSYADFKALTVVAGEITENNPPGLITDDDGDDDRTPQSDDDETPKPPKPNPPNASASNGAARGCDDGDGK